MMLDQVFLGALLRADSFYRSALLFAAIALGLLLALGWLLGRRFGRGRRGLHELPGDQNGAASAVDFALTLPLAMFAVMLIVQFMVMCNDALIVHYSAYAAARSARVWTQRLPPVSATVQRARVERAARLALIPASPADPRVRSRAADFPASMLDAIAKSVGVGIGTGTGHSAGGGPLLRKAAYAFDPRNSRVEFSLKAVPGSALRSLQTLSPAASVPRPVTARVSFRVHLGISIVRQFGTDRGDGQHYTEVDAEMTLL